MGERSVNFGTDAGGVYFSVHISVGDGEFCRWRWAHFFRDIYSIYIYLAVDVLRPGHFSEIAWCWVLWSALTAHGLHICLRWESVVTSKAGEQSVFAFLGGNSGSCR